MIIGVEYGWGLRHQGMQGIILLVIILSGREGFRERADTVTDRKSVV